MNCDVRVLPRSGEACGGWRSDQAQSQALPEFQFLLDLADRTRGRIALSVLQHDQVLALERWLKLLDLVNVDDYRAADAQESLRGEMGFQRTHGFAQDMILLADMHYSVFSGGLDGLDLVQLHKGNLARGFDGQSSELTCRFGRGARMGQAGRLSYP